MFHRVLLVVFVVACGVEIGEPPEGNGGGKSDGTGGENGSGGGSGGGSTPAITATMFLGKVGMQYCDECFRCKATYPTGQAAFANDFGTITQCYSDLDAYYQVTLVAQSIAAGRVVFSPVAALQCLAGIKYVQDCNTFWQNDPTFPAACDAALVGTVANGGACVSGFDCASLTSRCDSATKKCVAN